MTEIQNKLTRVAIVGSGPSGFYAAEALLRSDSSIAVDMYEKLPAPYGLVRFGVAPDHPKLKLVVNIFDRIAQMEGFRFLGNVCIGKDISIEDLSEHYHAVIFACGAEREKDLGVPGESLTGSHSAREFVAWYNGHPEYRHLRFDFSHKRAVVIGQGNVALDIARILSKTVDELRSTDIADYALEALAESKIQEVHIVGRRGPAQAKFTDKELREFGELANCTPVVSTEDMQLNQASIEELEDAKATNANSNIQLLQDFLDLSYQKKSRSCHFRFFLSPYSIDGTEQVEKILLEQNYLAGEAFQQKAIATGGKTHIDCGLVFRCIGYQAMQMTGLPYDSRSGVLSHQDGRLISDGNFVPGLYATGWVKRGPSGTIGTNRGDSVATVSSLLQDLPQLTQKKIRDADQLLHDLNDKKCQVVDYSGWKKIDAEEVALGASAGKPRIKLTKVTDMLKAVNGINIT